MSAVGHPDYSNKLVDSKVAGEDEQDDVRVFELRGEVISQEEGVEQQEHHRRSQQDHHGKSFENVHAEEHYVRNEHDHKEHGEAQVRRHERQHHIVSLPGVIDYQTQQEELEVVAGGQTHAGAHREVAVAEEETGQQGHQEGQPKEAFVEIVGPQGQEKEALELQGCKEQALEVVDSPAVHIKGLQEGQGLGKQHREAQDPEVFGLGVLEGKEVNQQRHKAHMANGLTVEQALGLQSEDVETAEVHPVEV